MEMAVAAKVVPAGVAVHQVVEVHEILETELLANLGSAHPS